jgi:hypothetical protein
MLGGSSDARSSRAGPPNSVARMLSYAGRSSSSSLADSPSSSTSGGPDLAAVAFAGAAGSVFGATGCPPPEGLEGAKDSLWSVGLGMVATAWHRT